MEYQKVMNTYKKEKLKKILQYLHTQKSTLSPLMKYLLLLNKDYFYYYLFMHPDVVNDQNIRDRLITNYLRDNSFRRETRDYYHDRYSPTFVNNLRRLTYANIYQSFQRYNRNHNRHNDININLREDQLKRDLWQQLQQHYQQIHEDHIKDIHNKPPNKDEPLTEDNLSDAQKRIDDILKKHREQMDKRHRKVQKDAENRVKVLTERMNTKNGSKYKRWLSSHAHNTRHECNDGQIVPIDKKFIIVNDRTGQLDLLDYPGDPTGSPANVYNCLCDVDFDEDILKDGINPTEIDYQQVKQTQTQKSEEITKSEKIRKLLSKNRTHRTIKNIDKYVTNKQINKIYNKIKDQFPEEFSEQSIKEIIKIQQAFQKDANEHGGIINLNTGEIFNPRDGENSTVKLTYSGIKDTENLASIHNHPIRGFNAPSPKDLDNMLHNPHEKYCIVLSESKIWILKNKYNEIDLFQEELYNGNLSKEKLSKIYSNCINIVKEVKNIFNQNRVKELENTRFIENINTKTDKELSNIYDEFGFYSKVININE